MAPPIFYEGDEALRVFKKKEREREPERKKERQK